MRSLEIYVCENFAPDYRAALKNENSPDVHIRTFPCLCSRKNMKIETASMFITEKDPETDKIIVCSNSCDVLKIADLSNYIYEIHTTNYCFSQLIDSKLIEYIVEKGGYVLTNGWLNHWRERLAHSGFDKPTARMFYGEFCTELILLDTGINPEIKHNLEALSQYLDLPYRILNINLENLQIFLKSVIFEWRLQRQEIDSLNTLTEMRKESAKYSAVLSIIEQITEVTSKRDVIEKIKQIFVVLFGAQTVQYFDAVPLLEYLETSNLRQAADYTIVSGYCSITKTNSIALEITHAEKVFGTLVASEFLFPEHLPKYTNFASSIARVSGLAISNANQYEALERSKDELAYKIFHDSLTGLYNRNYFNHFISNHTPESNTVVFMFDIDNLKHVNDHLGHLYGDQLIQMTAQVLKESFRETDLLARLGGDEFAAIITSGSSELADRTVKRILALVEQKNDDPNMPFELGISIGYSCATTESLSWEALVKVADGCMYKNKAHRKASKLLTTI